MKTKVETITPYKAKDLLKRNTKNRPVSDKRVRHYSRLMKDGKWYLTHQGIAISENDVIIDGQHRLLAIIMANTSVDVNITYGLDDETFKYVDVGYTRTLSNIFAIENIPNYAKHSSGLSKYFSLKDKMIDVNTASDRSRIDSSDTHDDYLIFYYAHEELLVKIQKQTSKYYSSYRILKNSELYSYFCFLMFNRDHSFEEIKNFFDNVYMFNHDGRSTAPQLLFQKLISNATGVTEIKSKHKSALINKAWNYYKKGRSPKILKWTEETEDFPNLH